MERHYTPAQVAELLQVSRLTVYRWIARGRLRVRRVGARVVRVPESSIQSLLR